MIQAPSPARAPFDQRRVRSPFLTDLRLHAGQLIDVAGNNPTIVRDGPVYVTDANGVLHLVTRNRVGIEYADV